MRLKLIILNMLVLLIFRCGPRLKIVEDSPCVVYNSVYFPPWGSPTSYLGSLTQII